MTRFSLPEQLRYAHTEELQIWVSYLSRKARLNYQEKELLYEIQMHLLLRGESITLLGK